jgi:hypothetical protein
LLLGPPPSVHNILGAALHESNLKRKRMRMSCLVAGRKKLKVSLPRVWGDLRVFVGSL